VEDLRRDVSREVGVVRLTVRPLQDPREFEEAEEVQMSAWGMGPREATPKEVMIAINDNGGVILGAFDGRKEVGFAITLAANVDGHSYLYSHMTGVRREYQSKGVGYLLKQKQKEIALERGVGMIAWTFDPIISRNAHFNVRKLGAVARTYFVDYYGPMNDSINFGWETDRILCEWYVRPNETKRLRSLGDTELRDAHVAIHKAGEEPYSRCVDWDVDVTARKVLVDIPSDVTSLKAKNMDEGKRWRIGTREVFRKYFAAGFVAVALVERRDEFRYLLMKAKLPENFFLHTRPALSR
jgi:predicted GNAT superfamily acetyltransferase